MEGELGHIRVYCATHGEFMARVEFKAHGTLEIPAEIKFIHPLESRENLVPTGPQYEFGDKITTLAVGSVTGIVHGFVIQPNRNLLVLVWFNEMDRYQQLSPDHIKPDKGSNRRDQMGSQGDVKHAYRAALSQPTRQGEYKCGKCDWQTPDK